MSSLSQKKQENNTVLSASDKTTSLYCSDNDGGNLKEYKYFGKKYFHTWQELYQ